jgi:hypothetical protein
MEVDPNRDNKEIWIEKQGSQKAEPNKEQKSKKEEPPFLAQFA